MKIGETIENIPIESEWDINNWIKKGVLYSWNELIDIISDLVDEYKTLEEEYEDFKREVEDNYKPISVAEQVGYNERDFI